MLAISLVGALFGLGGLCFLLCITTFHYFKDKVDQRITQEMKEVFSSSYSNEFIKKMRKGEVPLVVIKDFSRNIFDISMLRRRLQSLLLWFPIAGCMAIISAILGSFDFVENELLSEFAGIYEYVVHTSLLITILIIVYCAIQLVRLTKELA